MISETVSIIPWMDFHNVSVANKWFCFFGVPICTYCICGTCWHVRKHHQPWTPRMDMACHSWKWRSSRRRTSFFTFLTTGRLMNIVENSWDIAETLEQDYTTLGNPRFHFHLRTLSQRKKLTLEYKKGGKKEFFKDLWKHEKTIEKEMSGILQKPRWEWSACIGLTSS